VCKFNLPIFKESEAVGKDAMHLYSPPAGFGCSIFFILYRLDELGYELLFPTDFSTGLT
jgi:hypothetical protein